ncbi:MAG TPA: HAD-IB family phosphatase [Steroidobacteraceae bacterium]|jgi:phosphatidylglycerophosphatase C|nr:HAD-IB family phosphatase [Steroidobacteraceae bacterium]
MSQDEPARLRGPPRTVALFDLDGTLTFHDTLMPFVLGFAARHPARLAGTWRLAAALAGYARSRDRGLLKSRVIRVAMGGAGRTEIDAYAQRFVDRLEPGGAFRAAGLATLEAHRAAGDRLVLLSASPDLYVPAIGKRLRFERTLCTEVAWDGDRLNGALKTANRRGEEKVRCLEWLRTQYPGASIVAYGNSASDLPHMRHADRAVLVNGDARARRLAGGLGIALADWA